MGEDVSMAGTHPFFQGAPVNEVQSQMQLAVWDSQGTVHKPERTPRKLMPLDGYYLYSSSKEKSYSQN